MDLAAPADAPTDGFAGWAVGLMDTLGEAGAGLAIALENLFPPLPSEVVLPLAGFAAGTGELSLVIVLVATTLGSVAGAFVLYWLGRWLGRDRLRAIVARMPLVTVADVDRAEVWFARHGEKAVFFGRMVPLVRSLVSVPAGVERMSQGRFLVLSALGSAIWNSVFVLAGYGLGEHWHRVEPYAGVLQKAVVALVAVAVGVFVVRRVARRHSDKPVTGTAR